MRIMAVDYGDARTGLAICDRGEMLASPVGVIHSHKLERTLDEVVKAVGEQSAEMVVVGHPLNMDGTVGARAELCQDFARRLEEHVSVPVRLWDERRTTVSATGFLNETNTRGQKRKNVVDAVAATIILDSYMAYRRNHPDA